MRSVAIHSHKGGVGKSTLSVNIAVELAKSNNVILIDNDLSGPSLQTFFDKEMGKEYFNHFLSQEVEIEECIHHFRDDTLEGNLYYCLADPTNKSLGNILRMDKKTATMMLRQLINMKHILKTKYNIDYLIIDTSPGVHITSVNAFVATDNILFVNKLSNADIEGSSNMIAGIMEYIDKRSFMVANQIPPEKIKDPKDKDVLQKKIEKNLRVQLGRNFIKLVGILPHDFKLQLHEFEMAVKSMDEMSPPDTQRTYRYIYAFDEPDSNFSTHLREIIREIFSR